MSTSPIVLREQILANARILFLPSPAAPNASNSHHTASTDEDIHVVIFGKGVSYTAAVLVHSTPALEGSADKTPESALRQLLVASAEVLEQYIPKLAGHQRTLHKTGGIFDEDMVAQALVEAKSKLNNDG